MNPSDPLHISNSATAAWAQFAKECEDVCSGVRNGKQVWKLSRKQKAIVQYLIAHGTITTAQATELVGKNVFYNQAKHTGAVLSNMVKRGILRRLRIGVYSL